MKCRTQKVCKTVFLSPSANVLPTSLCPPPRHNSYQIALCICQRKMFFILSSIPKRWEGNSWQKRCHDWDSELGILQYTGVGLC